MARGLTLRGHAHRREGRWFYGINSVPDRIASGRRSSLTTATTSRRRPREPRHSTPAWTSSPSRSPRPSWRYGRRRQFAAWLPGPRRAARWLERLAASPRAARRSSSRSWRTNCSQAPTTPHQQRASRLNSWKGDLNAAYAAALASSSRRAIRSAPSGWAHRRLGQRAVGRSRRLRVGAGTSGRRICAQIPAEETGDARGRRWSRQAHRRAGRSGRSTARRTTSPGSRRAGGRPALREDRGAKLATFIANVPVTRASCCVSIWASTGSDAQQRGWAEVAGGGGRVVPPMRQAVAGEGSTGSGNSSARWCRCRRARVGW